MSELFKVPGVLNRAQVWATKCTSCGAVVRLGRGNKAAVLRLHAIVSECRTCIDSKEQSDD